MIVLKSTLLTTFFLVLVLNLCFVTFNFQYIYLGISYSLVSVLFLINLFITFRNRDNLIFTIIFGGIVISNMLAYLFIKFWIWLDSSESNLSPMIKIAITGGALAIVSRAGKEIGTQIWNWCHQYFVTMCVIKNLQNPNLFQYLLKYFVSNRHSLNIQKARIELIQTNIKKTFWTHTIETNTSSVCWTPDNGHHLFYYNYEGTTYKVILDISSEISQHGVGKNGNPFERRELKMYILGRNRKHILIDLCEKAKQDFFNVPNDYISIMTPDRWGNIWEQDKLIEKVDQRHIFSPLKTKIIEKCRKFISGEEHYNLVGKDYRLCLMFHGPPGNGKSKMIKVLASCLNYNHICTLNLEHEHITKANIHKLIRDTPEKSIITIEDIDKTTRLTNSSTFLNLLDGITSYEKKIFIITTNNIDDIDYRIRRRCDSKYYFSFAQKKQIVNILKYFYTSIPDSIINQFIEIIGERQIRMNDLYNYLLYQTIASKLPERIILKENIKELIDVDC